MYTGPASIWSQLLVSKDVHTVDKGVSIAPPLNGRTILSQLKISSLPFPLVLLAVFP